MKKSIRLQINVILLIITMVISIAVSPMLTYAAESTDQKVERILSEEARERLLSEPLRLEMICYA